MNLCMFGYGMLHTHEVSHYRARISISNIYAHMKLSTILRAHIKIRPVSILAWDLTLSTDIIWLTRQEPTYSTIKSWLATSTSAVLFFVHTKALVLYSHEPVRTPATLQVMRALFWINWASSTRWVELQQNQSEKLPSQMQRASWGGLTIQRSRQTTDPVTRSMRDRRSNLFPRIAHEPNGYVTQPIAWDDVTD